MQAARGTSLNDDERSEPDRRSPTPGATPYVVAFLLTGLCALVLDQVTKALAATQLADREPVRVVGGLLRLTLVFNPGAAFSTGTRFTVGLTILAVVAAAVITWFGLRARTPLWTAGLGLLLAGVTGNLADRIFRDPGPMRGHVVDFLQLPHWPVFNVADICINIGAVVLVVQAFRGVRLDGRPTPAEPAEAEEQTEGAR